MQIIPYSLKLQIVNPVLNKHYESLFKNSVEFVRLQRLELKKK